MKSLPEWKITECQRLSNRTEDLFECVSPLEIRHELSQLIENYVLHAKVCRQDLANAVGLVNRLVTYFDEMEICIQGHDCLPDDKTVIM